MTKAQEKALLKVAQENIRAMENRSDLKEHRNGEEDFLEITIWDLEAALKAAFELGKASK